MSSDIEMCPNTATMGPGQPAGSTKTDYDHGFAEFCFSNEADQAAFQAYVPDVSYGENYGFYRPEPRNL